ncbi:hypothetical protein OG921_07910 [Aldersonia sp. NBC_00410]|uniref:hypothetical protein n=1 Tax=Aldersonia sp. NBC_00410 TaxID=2975954 RepID=UPI002258EBF5|nr:hypothetical protein [Aldersonia sp. NBC_00410]MCX5043092.1 hypothetical protein [Aldersonia sp. NBC_00410]
MKSKRATAIGSGFAALVIAASTSVGVAGADPNIQIPGVDDGLPNCAVLNLHAFAGYIGTGDAQPPRAMDEDFAAPRSGDWCNTNVGYSTTQYGPGGVTQINPPTVDGLFPYNNAEILPKPGFVPGMTMTYDIKGAPDMVGHNGTAGWGISNRTIDPVSLEVAWFMYNGSHGLVGAASELTRPIFNVLGTELPRGFFLMVKRAGQLYPQVKLLDPALLAGDHAYAVKLGDEYVDFFVDGQNVGAFRNPPAGKGIDIGQQPLPLMGQMWLDGSYWFPLPIPEYNDHEQRLTMTRYRQGPSESTPLT